MSVTPGSPYGRASDAPDAPQVSAPDNPWIPVLGAVVAVAIGGLVFWQLNANRERIEASRLTDPTPGAAAISSADTPPPPPALAMTAAAPAAPPPAEPLPVALAPAPPPPPVDLEARLKSPSLIVDLSDVAKTPNAPLGGGLAPGQVAQALAPPRPPGVEARSGGASSDEQFAARFGVGGNDSAPARAARMHNQSFTLVQGSVIPAVLETAVQSDLPGFVRAVVSRDVRSFDGAQILAPRGSRLVGQYRAGVALGQSRAFVIWTRLIRPDGVSVDLAAPATDALGRGGIEGSVDTHFLERFGGAILLSLISAAGAAAGDDRDTQVIIASTRGAASDAASVALQNELAIAPTVSVPQGSPIRVFVTRDVDFSVLAPSP